MIKLSEFAKVTAGQAAPKEFSNEGLPFIRAGHLEELLAGSKLESLPKVSNEVAKKKRLKVIPKGTILFAKSGMSATKNRVYVTEGESYFVSHLAGVLPSDEFSTFYLARFFSWYNPSKLILDSAYPSIRLEDIKNLSIPLPSIEEQKKIAAILDAADDYRQKTKALIDKYDQLTQSLFIDMFGDPVINPMGWEISKLKDLSTKIGSGNTPKGGQKVYVDEGILFFRSMNVWKNNIIYDNIAFIDLETHKMMPKSSLKHKDILMTKTGRVNTENSSLGRAAIYLGEDDKANVNGHVYLIRLKENILHEFVLHILTSNAYRDLIRRVCVGGIDKRQLNKNHIEEFPIISPPPGMQEIFVKKLTNIKNQKEILHKNLKKAEELFNSLLQKAFKGELIN